MGTVLEVTVETKTAAGAQKLVDQSFEIANRWDDVLTTWREDGELFRLNTMSGSREVSLELATALKEMRRFTLATKGLFDPAVGGLVRYYREQGNDDQEASREKPPRRLFVSAVRTDGRKVSLIEETELDAGGIGKGIAVDAVIEHLAAAGALSAWIDFGGSSQRAFGLSAGQNGYTVAIAGLDTGELLGHVELFDAALSTSRSADAEHKSNLIIDPRTGRPVVEPRIATVLANDATTAEVWSTVLVILGEAGLERAEAAGVEALIDTTEGVRMTAAFPLDPAR